MTQAILLFFLFFSISRVVLRIRSGSLSWFAFVFWMTLFGVGITIVIIPGITTQLARELGIGRGVDAVIYTSVVLLFYLVFRLHILVEDLRHEMTEIVRKMALNNIKKYDKKTSKN